MASPSSPHLPIRPHWLSLRQEAIIDPHIPIVDAHHHLWDRPDNRYLTDELVADTGNGHNIVSTVFVQCRSMLRLSGPIAMRPVGEVEFVNGVAAMGASGTYGDAKLCEAIVGGADLTLIEDLDRVLETMLAISGGRLRGIRNPVAWHPHEAVRSSPATPPWDLMRQDVFRQGVARLGRYNLSLDVWAYHTQLDDVYALAKGIPDVKVVIDHFGGPVGVGPHAGQRAQVQGVWAKNMARLAELPNTYVKLGGAGMPVFGFDFVTADLPPSSEQLADAWRPYFEVCVEAFGARRCMFESNFPVDKGMFSYNTLWNAFKRLAAQVSSTERSSLFSGTAQTVYRLNDA
jgi:predicted TIM-barrel fold metal-dependent hydrolase